MPSEIIDRQSTDQKPPVIDLGEVGLYAPPPGADRRISGRVESAAPVVDRSTGGDNRDREALRGFERRRYGAQFEQAYEKAVDTNFQYRSENLDEATKMAAKTGKPLVMVFSDIRNTALTPQNGLVGKEKALVGGQEAANEKAIYVFCDLDSVREKVARGENPPEAALLKEAGINAKPLRPEDGLFHPSMLVFGVRSDGSPTRMDVFQDVKHDPVELKNSIDRVRTRDEAERSRAIKAPPPPLESDIAPPLPSPEEFEMPSPASNPSGASADVARPNSQKKDSGDASPVMPPVPQVGPPPINDAEDVPPTPTAYTPPPPMEAVPGPAAVKENGQETPPPVPTEVPPLPESSAAVEPTRAIEPTKAVEARPDGVKPGTENGDENDFRRRLQEDLKKYHAFSKAIDMFYGRSDSEEKSFVALKDELSGAMKDFEKSVTAGGESEENFQRSNALLLKAAKLFQDEQARARAVEDALQGVDVKGAEGLRTQAQNQRLDEYRKWRDHKALTAFVEKHRDRLDLEGTESGRPSEEEWETRTP